MFAPQEAFQCQLLITLFFGTSQVALFNARDIRDTGLISRCGSGRSPGGGHGKPHQYACLENPMDRKAWLTSIGSQRVHAKSNQLCLTICNPMDCSPPGSSVHEIPQARILERVVISSSRDLANSEIQLLSLTSPASAGGLFTTSTTWADYTLLPQCFQTQRETSYISSLLSFSLQVKMKTGSKMIKGHFKSTVLNFNI